MATNPSLDPALIERAREVSGERTKRAVVTLALQEFILAQICIRHGMTMLTADRGFLMASKHCALRAWEPSP